MKKLISISSGKSLFIFAVTIGLSLISCSKANYSHLKWQSTAPVVDGKPDEWSIPLKFYDSETKLNYDISNDHKSLYVIFKISDELTKIRALKRGIQFAIDADGKKVFPVSISYINPLEEKIPLPDFQNSENTVSGLSGFSQILLKPTGFKEIKDNVLPLKNQYGIDAAFNIDSHNILYYELKIPFSTFYKEEITPQDTLNPFNFEITLNAFASPEKTAEFKDDNTTSTQPGGNGSFPGNNSGAMSGMNGGPGSGMQSPPARTGNEGNGKQTLTQKLKLSLR